MSLSRGRTSSESGKSGNMMPHSISPRLPRKSRQPNTYNSLSKLDNPGSLQMDQQYTEGRISPIPLTSPTTSPYISRPHRRDRAYADRYGSLDIRQSNEHKSRDKFSSLDRTAAMSRYGYRDQRDRSVERGAEGDYSSRSSSLQRNRSLDRDYPLVSLSMRSLADNYDPADADSAADLRYQQSQSSMLILSLQTQLVDLNKDYTIAQRELEQNKSQLNSYIASVKTFWSPELKKERALRKEETQKYQKTQTLLTAAEHEKQVALARLQNAEERLTLQGIRESTQSPVSVTSLTAKEDDRQEKELQILQNTVAEMERRIDLQKKTLAARDASIKKLVEMLQTKNIPIETILNSEAEKDVLRNEIAALQEELQSVKTEAKQSATQTDKLQEDLDNLKMELNDAKSNINHANRQSKNLDDVQALLDIKNTRISELEKELKDLENQVNEIRSSSSEKVSEEKRHIEALHSHEQVLKSKLENLRVECSSKTTEICSLQTRLDSIQSQRSDMEQHVEIIKQQLITKDSNIDLIKNEVARLEALSKEKDSELEKKNSQLESLKTDKIQLEGDVADIRYESEVANRKLSLLQKKLDNSTEQLREKDDEISSLESRLTSLSKSSSQSETISQLQESLDEKNRQLERMKEQREVAANERQDELVEYQKNNRDLSKEVELLKQSSQDSKNELLSLRESVSELKAEKLKLESQLNQAEKNLLSKSREVEDLKQSISQLESETKTHIEHNSEQKQAIQQLSKDATQQGEQLQNYQKEIDRLLEILKEMENEKHNKDKQIRELQEQLKETKQKYVSLKRNHQHDEKLRLEENKNGRTSDSEVKARMKRDKERIEELEEALKQSVKITAKCEMVVASQKEDIDKQKSLIEQYKSDVAKATEISLHVHDLEETLKEKNDQLRKLVAERSGHMEEAFEMKQEAILSAISEKDTHIALLEASKTKNARDDIEKLTCDKQRLNLKLKDLTTQRMLLVVKQSSDNSKMLASQQTS
ncbi:brp [Bugula neritina]|uniref:Brp n=1 Tax=Bugula neritina TaxID=10212 RepID=A0A7J7IVC1_BUGNE|nr:brp [Bugula neritina]